MSASPRRSALRARGSDVYAKPSLTHEQLVERMRSRGLVAPDHDRGWARLYGQTNQPAQANEPRYHPSHLDQPHDPLPTPQTPIAAPKPVTKPSLPRLQQPTPKPDTPGANRSGLRNSPGMACFRMVRRVSPITVTSASGNTQSAPVGARLVLPERF